MYEIPELLFSLSLFYGVNSCETFFLNGFTRDFEGLSWVCLLVNKQDVLDHSVSKISI